MASPQDSSSPTWQDELGQWLHEGSHDVEGAVDRAWRRFRKRMGMHQPRSVNTFVGWSDGRRAVGGGRVLANRPYGGPKDDDSWWDNLVNTWRRWESDEVPFADVEIRLGDAKQTVRSDEEGYFNFEFELSQPLKGYWHESVVTVRSADRSHPPVHATCPVITPPEEAAFVVISDMDDTVIHTGITNIVMAAKLTFLNNAKTRKPLEGVSALYKALHTGSAVEDMPPRNPIFYVSSSAWNLYDLLYDFLDLNDIPLGPLMLRDLGIDEEKFIKGDHGHKLEKAERIHSWFPDLPVVFFGDSGQADPQLYTQFVQRHPGKVKAIFIRDVDPLTDTERDQAVTRYVDSISDSDVPMHLIGDAASAATYAVQHGLIPEDALAKVHDEKEKDEKRPAPPAVAAKEAATSDGG